MPALTTRVLPLALCLLAAGCASRPLPKYEKPLARAAHQNVRTTAYTHTEDDHLQHGRSTAAGGRLQCGSVNSAACDWSRWPVDTVFRLQQTGELFKVDDYGWALSGTNPIDLYKSSRRAMNSWGVRRVDIEILQWGDVQRSLAILRPRAKYRHVRRMVDQIEDRYAELSRPLEAAPSFAETDATSEPASSRAASTTTTTAAPVTHIAMEPAVPRATAVSGVAGVRVATGGFIRPGQTDIPLKPFNNTAPR